MGRGFILHKKKRAYIIKPKIDYEKNHSTKELQILIDECSESGGGEIHFEQGCYVLSTVFLKSNVSIVIGKGVHILGSLNFNDYHMDERVDYPLYQDASHSFFHCSLFVGIDCENISIVGEGTIDMRSVWDNENKRNMVHRGAKCIALKGCRNVELKEVSIYNATDLAVYFAGCDNVVIDGLTLRVHIDGISPDNSKNVVIRNCNVESGDDGIVFKSSYVLNHLDICQNILVENCKVKSRCNALKFGTETNGGFENISIQNIYVYDTRLAGICIESIDGAVIDNIRITDITMKNVATPIFLHLGKRLRGPKGVGIGTIENILLENIRAEGPYEPYECIEWNYKSYLKKDNIQYPWFINLSARDIPSDVQELRNFPWQTTSNICGLKNFPLKNITLRNIDLNMEGGVQSFLGNVSEEPLSTYPEVFVYGKILPAKGIYFRYIDGLLIENVKVKSYLSDKREDFVFNKVENLLHIKNYG